jgi:hypothetical protein
MDAPNVPEVPEVSTKTVDTVVENPYLHFVSSEVQTALASITVYGLSRGVAAGIQYINKALPLDHNPVPEAFLTSVILGGGAISASATFLLISVYQISVLFKRLRRQWERS